jgi:hypothetical protein
LGIVLIYYSKKEVIKSMYWNGYNKKSSNDQSFF